jgi:hypothetical protein
MTNVIDIMRNKILSVTLMILAVFTAVSAQTLDKAKLDQFFDRLAEKNKAMGSLTIAKDGSVLYTRAIGYRQINGTEKKPLTAASRCEEPRAMSPEMPENSRASTPKSIKAGRLFMLPPGTGKIVAIPSTSGSRTSTP